MDEVQMQLILKTLPILPYKFALWIVCEPQQVLELGVRQRLFLPYRKELFVDCVNKMANI